jgi:hypothetical protein
MNRHRLTDRADQGQGCFREQRKLWTNISSGCGTTSRLSGRRR